ncbi:MAG: hypothetical protein PVI03_05785 [Candidatus Thorarchaeota archaeon]
MSPRVAARIRRLTGRPLICRECMLDSKKAIDRPQPVCNSCGERIEPRIFKRILRARARGRNPPMMCKRCFLEHRPKTIGKVEREGVPFRVEEWECVKCGAPLEPEEVDKIKKSQTIECDYCGSSLTRDLFT